MAKERENALQPDVFMEHEYMFTTFFRPIYDAVIVGLSGYSVNVSIKTDADNPNAKVTITYPDRRRGSSTFEYSFDLSSDYGEYERRWEEFLSFARRMRGITETETIINGTHIARLEAKDLIDEEEREARRNEKIGL